MSDRDATAVADKIPIGISSCLMGEPVRHDGGHKAHPYIMQTLGAYFELRSFCPELAIGLGVPRKPIRLQRKDGATIRCVFVDDDSRDCTDALQLAVDEQSQFHGRLCGYILKQDSPSCGMEKVKVWEGQTPLRDGVGIFARRLIENFPYLPVEEEGRLGNSGVRENFIHRVFALSRWHEFVANRFCVNGLIDFHARHSLVIMSHDRLQKQRLEQLVAATDESNLAENAERYLHRFMKILSVVATRENHLAVLRHVKATLPKQLSGAEESELVEAMEKYRAGGVSVMVPITLLNRFFKKHPNDSIVNSWYMNPTPAELQLRGDT
ncbi:MAG TPA: hypothetical protein DCM64_00220 [Gammaproteobacteria bacterium]|jgi:uncharacterized protein YbbK (DUF523 family)/uncharacterized protein YbgA (DUF1722 family)|nr:DUF523 and DUF1722 domain-containing protein [Gammaproteobacteria bacterium]MDP6732750.1 DUF523 and DUF1722 domain-containing protein [Gammaproteobacteria bacterium]HAJ74858.1 hypothetical protein [Gammaproteobacteria bacterium]|tara:strand:- start:967 stop:1938 length:972 start_codon:yes stop_codon:yes gene_type:complete